MDALIWMFLPLFVAAGSASLAFYVMQARMEVAVSKEREALAEAKAVISAQDQIVEHKIRAAQEATKSQALNDFLADFRVEERHYLRESKSLFMNRKSMILQERLYFRNIPLCNWVEHEMPVEEGGDIQQLAKACSIFASRALAAGGAGNGNGVPEARLLR